VLDDQAEKSPDSKPSAKIRLDPGVLDGAMVGGGVLVKVATGVSVAVAGRVGVSAAGLVGVAVGSGVEVAAGVGVSVIAGTGLAVGVLVRAFVAVDVSMAVTVACGR
jgi:hypothetical protein